MASYGPSSHMSKEDIHQVLLANIRQHDVDKVRDLLSGIKDSAIKRSVLHGINNDDETVLHTAVKLRCNNDMITCVIETCPELLIACRESSNLYRGQTALHIAVTDGNTELVDCLLSMARAEGKSVWSEVLRRCATGSRFENTVMMGELPLTVAALTLNTRMIDLLVSRGANIGLSNSEGDSIIHSLIKYAFLYPEKIDNILAVCDHIASIANGSRYSSNNPFDLNTLFDEATQKRKHDVWLKRNNARLNPLQLSAKLGQHGLFKFIIEMKGVYSYVNSDDGLFDVELYDVTDIDTLHQQRRSKVAPHDTAFDGLTATLTMEPDSGVPTLEMIFNSSPEIVFKFIEMTPLRYAINRKWAFYRWFYGIWTFIHMIFMIGFTVYAIRRSELEMKTEDNKVSYSKRYVIGKDPYETIYVAVSLGFATVYLSQEIVRMMKRQMPWSISHLMNCYHNGPFRLMLLLFSITVLADSIWAIIDEDCRDYLLVCAMILGWWFIVFFLRCYRQFSFFTVMIQKVLVGDMFRFSIIITMELIAFTGGLFIAFRGSVITDENMHSYFKLMVLMFKAMFGFISIDVLFEAREPWFAICIYVAFVILTYVLMVNSLIAMMSNTCSMVSKNRDIQFRVQQLSTILFFESVFPSRCKKLNGSPKLCNWYDYPSERFMLKNRYFMEVKSLHEVTKSKSRHRPKPETMLETIFHTIQHLPNLLSYNETPVELVRGTSEGAPSVVNRNNSNAYPTSSRKPKKKKKKRQLERTADELGDASDDKNRESLR